MVRAAIIFGGLAFGSPGATAMLPLDLRDRICLQA
jgi:hypothetical protein